MGGRWVHRLTDVNPVDRTAACLECGPVRVQKVGAHGWGCATARNQRQNARLRPWRAQKKDFCENPECTATIEDSCQLDVDHIDGNKKNNDLSNLVTLCANCHRLKSKQNKDWMPTTSIGVVI